MNSVTLKCVLLVDSCFRQWLMQTLQSTVQHAALFTPACCTHVRHAGIQKNSIAKLILEFEVFGNLGFGSSDDHCSV